MKKYVDVTNDVAFRKIFGNPKHSESLISFLNAALELHGDSTVCEVTIVNPYLFPRIAGEKASVIDVKARDHRGRQFIVEMQVPNSKGFAKRVQYYAYRDFSMQINRGDDYNLLQPTHFIGILDFPLTKGTSYLSHHLTLDRVTNEHVLTDVQFVFIELPKFKKELTELESAIDHWVYFIKNSEILDGMPQEVEDLGLRNAYLEADRHNWSKEEFLAYDDQFIAEQDARGVVDLAVMESQLATIRGLIELKKLSMMEIASIFGLQESQIQQIKDEMGVA